MGAIPSSNSTLTFVVSFCTPKICFNMLIHRLSIGLDAGMVKQPQKSKASSEIGLTREFIDDKTRGISSLTLELPRAPKIIFHFHELDYLVRFAVELLIGGKNSTG